MQNVHTRSEHMQCQRREAQLIISNDDKYKETTYISNLLQLAQEYDYPELSQLQQ